MPKPPRQPNRPLRWSLWLLVAVPLLWVGCDLGTYDKRFRESNSSGVSFPATNE